MSNNKLVSVFGASGRVGKEAVKLALLQGFKVNAHCRPGSECGFKHDNLTVFKGDLKNYELIKDIIRNSYCVIITFGQRYPAKDIFCGEATRLIITAMKELNLERIVCITGAMIGYNENLTLPFRIMKFLVTQRFNLVMEDRKNQEDILKHSGLEWTIVKPPRLIENGERKIFIYSENLSMGLSSRIGFDDLAEFLVEQINSKDYLQKQVFVKY